MDIKGNHSEHTRSGRNQKDFCHESVKKFFNSVFFPFRTLMMCFYFWFFSKLAGEEGPKVCFLKTLSAPLTFFQFLKCLFEVCPIHLF